MTPLAQRLARELTLPVKDRTFDDKAGLLALVGQDMHCFEISAIVPAVSDVIDEENMWPEITSMMPGLFLPSPVTWLEYVSDGSRLAFILQQEREGFRMDIASEPRDRTRCFSMPYCRFRLRSALEVGERVEVTALLDSEAQGIALPKPAEPTEVPFSIAKAVNVPDAGQLRFMTREQRNAAVERAAHGRDMAQCRADEIGRQIEPVAAEAEMLRAANTGVVLSVLLLDLINTPGVVGLRQHNPHRALARQLQGLGVGRFPLRGWSEVVVKTHSTLAGVGEHLTGPAFHKCLHFVRSHARHYRDGKVSIIPAHWRGDPALGIKRTRYRVERTAQAMSAGMAETRSGSGRKPASAVPKAGVQPLAQPSVPSSQGPSK